MDWAVQRSSPVPWIAAVEILSALPRCGCFQGTYLYYFRSKIQTQIPSVFDVKQKIVLTYF